MLAELAPRLLQLARQARGHNIGLTVDAEEADRLELSLDVFEAAFADPALAGWDGFGIVVQAYQKRAPAVIDWTAGLARRHGRRIPVRLVKGAYWDSEVKRAQVDGLAGYPVFTRKPNTDVSYLACAARLLSNTDAIYPMFATHNAQTIAAVHRMAQALLPGADADADAATRPSPARGGTAGGIGDPYEFQKLHGMGDDLYAEVIPANRLGVPCRVYAPVGSHEDLLPYLVRRLLENGANSSFVNRIADPAVSVDALVADPAATFFRLPSPGDPHPGIRHPRDLYPGRRNSAGLDIHDEDALALIGERIAESQSEEWLAAMPSLHGNRRTIRNPADHRDVLGTLAEAGTQDIETALASACRSSWPALPVEERAARLETAADLMERSMPALIPLLMREAGKTLPNGISEVREAVDFLRYYASQARARLGDSLPLGPIACISPWNFPLAIFTGQVAAALAAGNPVLAKPAEETPLIAGQAVRLLHEAGIPPDALQLLPGDGEVGAALVGFLRYNFNPARIFLGDSGGGQGSNVVSDFGGQRA